MYVFVFIIQSAIILSRETIQNAFFSELCTFFVCGYFILYQAPTIEHWPHLHAVLLFSSDTALHVTKNDVETNDRPVDFSKKSEAKRDKLDVHTSPASRTQLCKDRNSVQDTDDSQVELCLLKNRHSQVVDLVNQSLVKEDKLCRNTESKCFQESANSMSCKGENIQRTYEQENDSEFMEGDCQRFVSNCLYGKDGREHKTIFVDRNRMKDKGYCNSESPLYWHGLNSKHQQDFTNSSSSMIEQLSSTDQDKSGMNSAGYSNYAIRKISGFHPGFTLHRDSLSSRSDLEYLHQCYFRQLTNDYGGELLDFSMKEDNVSKTIDKETINPFSVENGSVSKISESKSEGKRHTHSVLRSPTIQHEGQERSFSEKRFGSWTVEETKVSENFQNKNADEIAEMEAVNRSKEKEGDDCVETEPMDIKVEPYEPVNLKVEPEEKNPTAIVKIEPGTDNTSSINKILSDPNVSTYTAQGQSQGHSPTSALTMHLNFSCKICGQNFKNRQYRDFHVKLHGSSHQYFCNLCSAGFDNETECQNHQREHTEPVFQCENCGYRCTREFRMRAHKEICGSPSKIFKCPFCYKQFAAHRYLRIHIKSHDAHNIHTCPICQNTYPLKNSLLKHMKKKHSQN